jgi:hypothetical protein
MLTWLYTRILKKLNLSSGQMQSLSEKLADGAVCVGPFQKDGLLCPNSSALALKLGRQAFTNAGEIRRLLKRHGVSAVELWAFYVLFDIPSLLSNSTRKKLVATLTVVAKERHK